MATKAQERAALEKIRKIVDGLGEESYIGHAMDGVFEDAEQNIENDFWNSYRDRYEYMNVQCGKAEDEIVKLNTKISNSDNTIKGLTEEVKAYKDEMFKAREEKAEEKIHRIDAEAKAEELQRKVEEQELEIIKLKAKLYDMMVGA